MIRQSVVLATHYWSVGPASALDEYLRPRASRYLYIAHPLFAGPTPAYFRRYDAGALVEEGVRPPALRAIRFLVDLWRTIRWTRRRYKLFIAGDNLLALAALWQRRRGRVDKVILYSIDYSPRRFANPIANRIYHAIDRFAARHVDAVWNAAAGVAVARRARDGAYPSSPQLVVPVGASYRRIRRYPISQINPHRIVFLGHLLERQGVQLVIEALVTVRRTVADASLMIIGDGPYADSLKQLAGQLGLQDAVDFAGYRNDHEWIEAQLARCAVGVAPYAPQPDNLSQFTDLPGKVKNYLACGLAVVMTALPQQAHLVEQAGAGRIVAYRTDDIAAAMTTYLTDLELLARTRDAAARLGASFDWDDIFDHAFDETAVALAHSHPA